MDKQYARTPDRAPAAVARPPAVARFRSPGAAAARAAGPRAYRKAAARVRTTLVPRRLHPPNRRITLRRVY